MKEKKPPRKQIGITDEAYQKLKKIGDESYSMTDRINYLLGKRPTPKPIPYAVAQASILANLLSPLGNMDTTKSINRSEIMRKIPKKLIDLGWDKVHPELFEDLKSWRCPIKVFLDNVIKSLVIKDVIKKHSTDTTPLNYRLNDNYVILFITPINEYLMSADDYLATYKDDSYSIRLTLEDIIPFGNVKQLVESCRR